MTAETKFAFNEKDDDELVLTHLWLADTLAQRLRGRGEDEEDLKQVARCALVEAAQRYDPNLGPFVPYASPTISGVLKRHFRDRGWVVRPPRRIQQVAVQITQHWPSVVQQCHTTPRDEDLADILGEPISIVREARRASQSYRGVPIDMLSPSMACTGIEDPGFERCEGQLMVAQAWRVATPYERELLRMRFWEQRSQSDIANQLGISQMQVSRLLTRLFKKLRVALLDDEYLAA